jgi:pimeloyl-ACP methyl ester carboxylesterase
LEQERRRRGSADYRAASGTMRDVLVTAVNESYREELEAISVPVALIWGADDEEVRPAVAEEAKAVLATGGVLVDWTVLEGVGHLVPTQAPAALRTVIDSMLER